MSRSVIRRCTATVALLAVFGLALPAGAAPIHRRSPAPVASIGFFDQVLTWLGSLWAVPAPPAKQPARAKGLSTSDAPTSSIGTSTSTTDRGGAIDPWGGS
jgi:hypothetical protein